MESSEVLTADSITHNFDRPVHDEGVARLPAVPLPIDTGAGGELIGFTQDELAVVITVTWPSTLDRHVATDVPHD